MGKSLENIEPMAMTALAQFVRDEMERQRLSTYALAEKASALGDEFKVSHSTVHNLISEKWKFVQPTTIRAVARGLGVREEVLLDIARGKTAEAPAVLEGRSIVLPDTLWEVLEKDARRCRRSVEQQVEAILSVYFFGDADVNIKEVLLNEMRIASVKQQQQAKTAASDQPASARRRLQR